MNDWIEGIHYYYDRQGLVVLTAAFLQQRGHCCGNGCLHCPYNFINVPEPKKSRLLADRKRGLESTK